MPSTTIHFIRHGKVENPDHLLYERLPGFHLSDLGRRMARAAADYAAADPQLSSVVAVYSSPLDRTRETAGIIIGALNKVRVERGEQPLELQTDSRIIEAGNEFRGKRIGYGEGALWRNGNWHLVRNLWKTSWGESYQHIAEGFYSEHTMPPTTEQAVIMLASHFYESRDGSTGGFFSDNVQAGQQVWNTVNLLLRLDRDWKV